MESKGIHVKSLKGCPGRGISLFCGISDDKSIWGGGRLSGDGPLSKIKVNSPVFRTVQEWGSGGASGLMWAAGTQTSELTRVRREMWSLLSPEA